jgi:CspA family cold shock protein
MAVFKDQLVRCAACGTTFVYTVREQRQRAERGLPVEPPAFCPDCRGADSRLAEAAEVSSAPAAARPSAGPPAGPPAGRRSGPPRDGQGRGRDRRPPAGGRPGGRPPARQKSRRPAKQTELRFRHMGVVKWFDDDKGYGFIAQDEDGDELFVHSTGVLGEGAQRLVEGQAVEFEIERTPRGLQAVDVIPLS